MSVKSLVEQALGNRAGQVLDEAAIQQLAETIHETILDEIRAAPPNEGSALPAIHLHVEIPQEREGTEKILAALAGISEQLAGLTADEGAIMTSVDEIIAKANSTLTAVQNNTSLNQSIAALVDHNTQTIADLQKQLQDAGTDQAKLQQLSDAMDAIQAAETANGAIVAQKITANTPAANAG